MPTVDPATCAHPVHAAFVEVYRLSLTEDGKPEAEITMADVAAYSAEIRINCAECDTAFAFIGPPAGLSPTHVCTDAAGTVLRAPIKPYNADEDFGRNIPGYRIAVTKHDV